MLVGVIGLAVASAFAAATGTIIGGGGMWSALVAYSLGGSIGLFAAALPIGLAELGGNRL